MLSFRILPGQRSIYVVLALFLCFCLGSLGMIHQAVERFKIEEMENSMKWMSNSIVYFCSSSEDELNRIGAHKDEIQLLLKQANTLEFIEDFIRRNSYKVVVYEARGAESNLLLNSFEDELLLVNSFHEYSNNRVVSGTIGGVEYNGLVVSFESWNWEMYLFKDSSSYNNLLSRLNYIYIAFGVLMAALAFAIILLFKQVVNSTHVLKESRKQMKFTLDALHEGVLTLDENGRVLQINPAGVTLLGLESEVGIVGHHVSEHIHLELVDTGKPLVKEAFQQGGFPDLKSFHGEDYSLVDHHGNRRRVQVSGASSKFTKDRKSERQLVLSMFDITVLKDTEKRLHQAQRMETVGVIAGGVAHDLNNTLSGLVTYPQLLLLQTDKKSKLRRPLESILKSGKQAAAIVDDLLTVARGAASAREISNLNDIFGEFLQSSEYRNVITDPGKVQVQYQLDRSLPNISCSPVHIRKCMLNLLLNAVEAMEGGGICMIHTKAVTVNKELAETLQLKVGQYASLTFVDNGQGVGEKDLPHIFEPFYSKKKMGRSGSGLGLAVVWNTMQDHGGLVTVESDGCSTCFILYFPATMEPILPEADNMKIADLQGDGEIILVVDDSQEQREITSSVLRALNYMPVSHASGEAAIDYLRDNDVDVLVLDMIMDPGISGYETYKEIVRFKKNQRAIVVSGYSESDDVTHTLELGAGGLVKKPYSMGQLGRVLKDVLADDRK